MVFPEFTVYSILFQFLDDTLEMAYEEFNCSNVVIAEYKRRSSNQCSDNGVYRSRARSIFHLFLQFTGGESTIKIEKYNSELNCYEEAGEITLGDRKHFSVILQQNKIYVLGGRSSSKDVRLKSVRVKLLPDKW